MSNSEFNIKGVPIRGKYPESIENYSSVIVVGYIERHSRDNDDKIWVKSTGFECVGKDCCKNAGSCPVYRAATETFSNVELQNISRNNH